MAIKLYKDKVSNAKIKKNTVKGVDFIDIR